MSESALQRWTRRFKRPDESPPSATSDDSDALLDAAKRRFVETFKRCHERLGMPPLDGVRSKMLEEIYGPTSEAPNK